jgi:leader peptidase (prepilin peptidase)/N-methyltransferase
MTQPRTPATAAGAGGALLLTLAAVRFTHDPLVLIRHAVLGAALGALAIYDLRERRIPNRVVLPAALICAALSLAAGIHPSTGLLAAGGLVAVLLAVSLAAPATLGMGDVKLALLILCALGSLTTAALLLTLELYALAAVLLLARHGRAALNRTLPLAPLIATSCVLALLL